MNDAPTARGSVGRILQRGTTVLTRVGKHSSQGGKQTIGLHRPSTTDSTRTEPATEIHMSDLSDLDQMLTGFMTNSNIRKIPGVCTQPTTDMPSESARIVKVDT